jgi:hypothetical protein
MSVWPEPTISHTASLSGVEGELVSASIVVAPQLLERLLETLAEVRFPVNPQIYHTAAVTYVYPDGHEAVEPTTIVEFPAYRERLQEVRDLLSRHGFDPNSLWAMNLLDDIHSSSCAGQAPPGAAYRMIVRRKRAGRAL